MAHFIRTIAALGHFFASMLLLFLIPACSSIETVAPERLFSGVLVDKDTGEGMSRLEVRLFWLKPKLITMGAWEPVAVTTTDAEGAFVFKVHGTGPYELRWLDAKQRTLFASITRIDAKPMRIEVDTKALDIPPPWALKP